MLIGMESYNVYLKVKKIPKIFHKLSIYFYGNILVIKAIN